MRRLGYLFAYCARAPDHSRYGFTCSRSGADPDTDLVRFPADGARVVVVNDRATAPRGMLLVRGADELSQLFDELTTFRTTSTYHEV